MPGEKEKKRKENKRKDYAIRRDSRGVDACACQQVCALYKYVHYTCVSM